jgi:phosphatidylglycerophosphate synthase
MNWFHSLIKSGEDLWCNLTKLYKKMRWPITSAICRILMVMNINQSHLTLSRIFILIALYFVWVSSIFTAALVLMLAVFILDCLDGDLSRMLGHDTPVGEFEDVMADNLACLILPLALIQTGQLKGVLGALFIFSALSVLWLAKRKKPQDGNETELIFWPRGDIFQSLSRKVIWFVMYLFVFFRIDIFNPSYAVISIVLSISTVVNYYQIVKSRL